MSLKVLNLQWLPSSKLIFILQSTWEALSRQETNPTYIAGSFHNLKSTEFAMASFLKIDIHFAKYLGSSLKAGNPPHLHSWIIPQAQKHWICNGFIPQNGCSFCKVPGRLSQGNKPTTYILGSFCKLKSTKLQWLHSSKLMFILQSNPRPRTIIVRSGFQECGIEIHCIMLEIVDHIVVLCVVSSSHKVTKVMPPQACFVGNSCHLQSSSISYEHPDHHQLLLWDSAAIFIFLGWLHIAK